MKNISRRSLMSLLAVASASLAVSACVTTRDGNKVTHSLNVTKIKAYGQAALNAGTATLAAFDLYPSLSGYVAVVREVVSKIQASFDLFVSEVGPSLIVNYDDTNVKTLVDSLFQNLSSLANAVNTILAVVGSGQTVTTDTVKKITLTYEALKAVVSIFALQIEAIGSTASNGTSTMSEAEALAILNVQ